MAKTGVSFPVMARMWLPIILILFPFLSWAGESERDYGFPVKGGSSPETAVPIEFNRDYKLDHHQKAGDYDYFLVNAEPGLKITIKTRTFDKGIEWRKGRARWNDKPFAGIELKDAQGASLRALSIAGEKNAGRGVSYRPASPGRYLVVVGNREGAIPKGEVLFKVTALPFEWGEMACGQPGAETTDGARFIDVDLYEDNCLGGEDQKDLFGFWGRKGDVYTAEVIPQEKSDAPLQARVFWVGKKKKKERTLLQRPGDESGAKVDGVKIRQSRNYYIEASLTGPSGEALPYSLNLVRTKQAGKR